MSMGVRQHCKSSPSPSPPPSPAPSPHPHTIPWQAVSVALDETNNTPLFREAGGGGGEGEEHGPINPQPSHAQSSARTVPVVKMKGDRCVCIKVLNTKWKAAGLETNTVPGRRASTQAYTRTMNSKPACSSRSPVTGFQGPSSVHHTHTHTHTRMHAHTHTHMHIHAHTHACTRMHTHAHAHTHTHTHTHTHIHAHMHTHAHAHMHTLYTLHATPQPCSNVGGR